MISYSKRIACACKPSVDCKCGLEWDYPTVKITCKCGAEWEYPTYVPALEERIAKLERIVELMEYNFEKLGI